MLKFARAIGANTDLLSAQAFLFHREDPVKGNMLLVLLISGAGEDIFTKIRQTSFQVEERFFESENPVSERFKDIFEFLLNELKELENLQILLAFIQENALSLKIYGQPQAWLYRDNQPIELITQKENNRIITGVINPQDKILFSLSQTDLQEEFFEKQLIKLLDRLEADNLEEEVTEILHAQTRPDPVAVIFIESTGNVQLQTPDTSVLSEPAGFKKILYGETPDLAESIKPIQPEFRSPFIENPQSLSKLGKPLIQKIIRKKLVWLVIIFGLVLVCLAVGVIYLSKNNVEKNSNFQNKLNQAREKFNLAKSLQETDSEQAKNNLGMAKENLNDALKIKPQDKQAKDLEQEIKDNSNQILKVIEIKDWDIFLSLDLIKPGFLSKRLSFSLGKLLLLDDIQKTLVVVDLAKKSNQILAGNLQLGDAKFASLNGTNAYVFSDKGVLKIDINSQKATEIIKPDPEWGEIRDIFGFSGNVYLLDSTQGQIWKYLPVAATYSKFNYLETENNTIKNSEKLGIDYSVWVSSPTAITKFTAGNEDNFAVGGLDKPILGIDSFFVSEDEDKVYILDKLNSRIVILKKSGAYLAQIIGDKLNNATDFIVNDEEKKLYLLEGGKIYQLNL